MTTDSNDAIRIIQSGLDGSATPPVPSTANGACEPPGP